MNEWIVQTCGSHVRGNLNSTSGSNAPFSVSAHKKSRLINSKQQQYPLLYQIEGFETHTI
jgi:hypothetical protein